MMENESKIMKRTQMVLVYLISFLFLIDSGSMYTQLQNASIKAYHIKFLLITLCILHICIHKSVTRASLSAAMITSLVVLFYILFSHQRPHLSSSLLFLVEFSVIMLFFFEAANNNELCTILDVFSKVVTFISLISLFFWLFGSIMHIIPGKQVLYSWGRDYPYKSTNYFYIYFENPVQATSSGIIRNTGLYPEAPGHVVRIIYALCIELFYKTEKSKTRLVILLVTMLSTLSSKGIILLTYSICVKMLLLSKKENKTSYYLVFLFSIIICIFSAFIINLVFESEMATTSSGMSRYDHMVSGFKTWLQYPLFGAGYNNSQALALNHMYSTTPQGPSMGIATTLGMGGVYVFLFYIASAFVAYRHIGMRSSYAKKALIAFIGAVLIDWFISNIGFSTIMIAIVSIGYSTMNIKNQNAA